jgi:uncharacterized protein YjbI with pentapeptide repeats
MTMVDLVAGHAPALEMAENEHRLAVSGISLSETDLGRLLSHMPKRSGQIVVRSIDIQNVTIDGPLSLANVRVLGYVSLCGVTIAGDCELSGASVWGDFSWEQTDLAGELRLDHAVIRGDLTFHSCTFRKAADLRKGDFRGNVQFSHSSSKGSPSEDGHRTSALSRARWFPVGSEIPGGVVLTDSVVRGGLSLAGCALGDTFFSRAEILGYADFRFTKFLGEANFIQTKLLGDANFVDAQFK